jgi:hypothetical protein
MRKWIDIINEAFTTPLPYQWHHAEASKHVLECDWARFKLPNSDKNGQVDFYKRRDGSVYVSFSVGASEQITGEGDAFTIFSTVLAIMDDYIARNPEMNTLMFDATTQEASRVKLYRAMVGKLLKSDWKVSEKTIENGQTQQFVLTRNNLTESQEPENVAQYILAASDDEQRETIMDILHVAELKGWGGKCFPAAIAINRVLFGGQGELVGYFNRAMLEKHNRFIGHVAVRFRNQYWDSDGRPKAEDEIESWGMLDHLDDDYDVDEDEASVTVEKTFSEDELLAFGDPAPFEQALDAAVGECFD